ncbi:hypothetical protein GJ744_006165 [Endocarpon pusillum]|uniref:Amino acid permease/ SLC12A domain-containing protein n=1 Tax=Endocarpon pusillum TaxID=364733 RepID=A0A8H7E0V3_9EURO|nr:hypothetical protein GJ744_006165 [Endocarpon pusillum]
MAEVGLRQELRGWQILLITISGVIGVTIFSNGGQALEIAGPGGMLCAYCIAGLIAIAVMEGVSEMVQLFPAPNAVVEYVKAFVDIDLAWVVRVAYWYTYSAIFATQIIAAAGFSSYWNFPQCWQTIVFYILSPIVILAINFAGVKWYGYVEAFGGSLKLCMVLGCGVFVYVIADQENLGSKYLEAGLQNNPRYASNHSQAVAYAVSIISYGFLAVEIVAMTAYEARDMKDLRYAAQELVEIMAISGSVSGLIVWASLCLAFIRYEYWLRMHKDSLHGAHYRRYNQWDRTVRESSTFLGYFQPVVAWAGLAGCLIVVFVFSSAMWWNGVIRFRKVASAYATPIILLALWIIRKIVFGGKHEHQRGWFVKLDDDFTELSQTFRRLEYTKLGSQSATSHQWFSRFFGRL